MQTLVLVIHVITAITIIGLVLVQHGKGADMGAAFGTGSAGSLFGSSGASNFLSKSTAIAAATFFITSLALAYLGSDKSRSSVVDRAAQKAGAVKADGKADAKIEPPKADAKAADGAVKATDGKPAEAPKADAKPADAKPEAPKAADIPK
jgi:preprotein translocase subunit SecG